ncbi:MAG: hypothetical protein QOI12_5299 [Alphaproteobacteria bacterium]|nr:hypothetical protein [Alphaproteobacteria bacterium]
MGLMDVLRGMNNGPRGQATPSGQSGSGMSPLTMGLLALLAYKAFKAGGPLGNVFGQNAPARPAGPNTTSRNEAVPSGAAHDTGGLMDWLRGSMGGAAAGAASGAIVSGGLGELVKRFQQNGYGEVADSWIKTGPNKAISPGELEKAAGVETLDALARESGVPREKLVADLSEELPDSVDNLTPEGRIPDQEEDEGEDEKTNDRA